MGQRGSGLAARFRAAVHEAEAEAKRLESTQKQRLEQARRARAELMDDLESFAADTGVLLARREGETLCLAWGERTLRFEPVGDGDRVAVQLDRFPEERNHLYRESHLGLRWVWSRVRRGQEDRVPLFDSGLEELLVRGLGLPRPADDVPVGPSDVSEPETVDAASASDGLGPKRTL